MKLKTLALTAVLAMAAAVAQAAPAAMTVSNFTGKITVTVNGVATTYDSAKGQTPVIPAGAQVAVVEGNATFQSGSVKVEAKAGDGFSYTSGASGVGITGTAGSVTVNAGGAKAAVTPGAAVAVQAGSKGATISVTAGTVAVTDPKGNTQSVATGKSAVVAETTQPVVSQDGPVSDSIETETVVVVTVVATSSLQEQTVSNCETGASASSPCGS